MATELNAWKVGTRCPRCNSPTPNLHPAVQFEGEVHPCSDPFHSLALPSDLAQQQRRKASR